MAVGKVISETHVDVGIPAEDESVELLQHNEQPGKAAEDASKADDELSDLPVDRGWAWMILVGAVLEVFVYGGILKTSGVFFVRFQERFGSNASETTLIQTLFNVAISLSGVFVMTVGMQYMTVRTSVCIGGVLTSLAYIVSAFATHIQVLYLSLGAVAGVSAAMIFLPIMSTIGVYFCKYRAMANSITMAGGSLGALVLGPLYTMMFDHYGYTGTMLISAGMLLNILVSGCLLRPPEFYSKRNRLSSRKHGDLEMKTSRQLSINGKVDESNGFLSNKESTTHSELSSDDLYFNEINNIKSRQRAHLLLRTISGPPYTTDADADHREQLHYADLNGCRKRAQSFDPNKPNNGDTVTIRIEEIRPLSGFINLEKANISLFANMDSICGSLVSLQSVNNHNLNNENSKHINGGVTTQKKKTTCNVVITKIVNFFKTVFDPSVFKDRVFIHFIILSFVAFAASVITPVYFIPLANDIDISSENQNIILILFGCTDLIARVSVGVITDRKWLRSTTIVGLAFVVMCVTSNLTHFIQTFWAMVLFVVVESALTGVYIALFAVILVENLGIDKFRSGLGFTNMSHGASGALFFPITGALRDVTGTYHWSYHLLSVLLLISACLAFTLPLTHSKCQKLKATEIHVTAELTVDSDDCHS